MPGGGTTGERGTHCNWGEWGEQIERPLRWENWGEGGQGPLEAGRKKAVGGRGSSIAIDKAVSEQAGQEREEKGLHGRVIVAGWQAGHSVCTHGCPRGGSGDDRPALNNMLSCDVGRLHCAAVEAGTIPRGHPSG